VAAFQRVVSKQFQAVTVPEPLVQEGRQIVDELWFELSPMS
jgi:hypothetical protein